MIHMVMEKLLLKSNWDILTLNGAAGQLQQHPVSQRSVTETLNKSFSATVRYWLYRNP